MFTANMSSNNFFCLFHVSFDCEPNILCSSFCFGFNSNISRGRIINANWSFVSYQTNQRADVFFFSRGALMVFNHHLWCCFWTDITANKSKCHQICYRIQLQIRVHFRFSLFGVCVFFIVFLCHFGSFVFFSFFPLFLIVFSTFLSSSVRARSMQSGEKKVEAHCREIIGRNMQK